MTYTREQLADELISAGDITRIAGISRQAIWDWKSRGKPMPEPVAYIGNRKRAVYLLAEVEEWLKWRKEGSDDE